MADNLHSLRRQKRPMKLKFLLNFAYFHITKQGQKTALNFPIFWKRSSLQIMGFSCLNAHLNGINRPLQKIATIY